MDNLHHCRDKGEESEWVCQLGSSNHTGSKYQSVVRLLPFSIRKLGFMTNQGLLIETNYVPFHLWMLCLNSKRTTFSARAGDLLGDIIFSHMAGNLLHSPALSLEKLGEQSCAGNVPLIFNIPEVLITPQVKSPCRRQNLQTAMTKSYWLLECWMFKLNRWLSFFLFSNFHNVNS